MHSNDNNEPTHERLQQRFDLWKSLTESTYPDCSSIELQQLRSQAASDWFNGKETSLTNLFDQYVMLKTLKQL